MKQLIKLLFSHLGVTIVIIFCVCMFTDIVDNSGAIIGFFIVAILGFSILTLLNKDDHGKSL